MSAHALPISARPQWTPGILNPARQLGAVTLGDAAPAACPTRSYWWLALGFAVGAVGAYQYSKPKRRGARQGG